MLIVPNRDGSETNQIAEETWPLPHNLEDTVSGQFSPVSLGSCSRLNQMVAMNGGGYCSLGKTRRNELKHSHLCCSILHRHTVCK